MGLILNIDTSLETASASIAREGQILAVIRNTVQKEHASFLHIAIADLSKQTGVELSQLDAIAVTKGPGSYTGLRVGMATAKGLAYALNKPFITINTLEAMALSAINDQKNNRADLTGFLFAPMIDARRMEVFTALYDENLKEIMAPAAMIVDENSYAEYLDRQGIFFFGNGAGKFSKIYFHANAFFSDIAETADSISILADRSFTTKQFANLAHSEPLYIKEFYDGK